MTPDRPVKSERTTTPPGSSAVLAPHEPRAALAWAMLACALAALTLAYPALSGDFLVNPRSDQYIAGFAFRDYAAQLLRTEGQFPQWNPFLLGGLPYIDAMHGDIFYPTFLLRMLMPTDAAMTWGMILHLWLAGVAGYALFRAHGLSFYAAITGGIAYMMSGMIAGLASPGHDGKLFISALFPLTLLALRAGVRHGRRWAWGVLALIVGLGVLTPHPQLFQYLLLGSAAYALFLAFGEGGEGAPSRRTAVMRLGYALGAVAIGFAIGAIQFWPVLNYVNASPRAGGAGWEHAISYSMPPEEVINTFLPQFSGILDNYWGRNFIHFHSEYLGLPVILLAAAAFLTPKAERKWVWFWTGMIVISAIWAFGGYTPFYRLVYLIPGTKYFRAPSTIMFITAFAMTALAAIGTQRIFEGRVTSRYLIGSAVAVGVLTLLGVSGAFGSMFESLVDERLYDRFQANRGAVVAGAIRMAVFSGATLALIVALTRKQIPRAIAGWVLAAMIAVDLWTIERNYWMFSPPASELYASDPAIERIKSEPQPGRVLAVELPQPMSRDPFIHYDALMIHGVRTLRGYHGNSLQRYDALIDPQQGGLNIASPAAWALLNVKWIYTNVDSVQGTEFEHVLGPVRNAFGSTIHLYRIREENPFAWVVPAIVKAPDATILAELAGGQFPLRSIGVFNNDAIAATEELQAAPAPLAIKANVTRWTPHTIDIELDAPAPAKSALMVSENFYPGWRATVDGQDAKPERANFTFIGVPLTAGARKIELRFVSETYGRGKAITLLAIGLAMALAIGGALTERRAKLA